MPETPPDRPRRKRLDNPAWRGGGFAMTTSLLGQGDAPEPRGMGRMAGLIEQVRSATFLLDENGVIREFRRDAEMLLGWRRDEVLGTHFMDLVELSDQDHAEAMLATVRGGDDARDVLDIVTEDGGPVRVEIHVVGFKDGEGHILMLCYANSSEDLYQISYDSAVMNSLFEQFPV